MNKLFFKFIAVVLILPIVIIACNKEKSHPAEPEMIKVKGGTFTMGCSDDECYYDELPQHKVTLKSFKIAKYPVTEKQFIAIMGDNQDPFQGTDRPVGNVSWDYAQVFIAKLNEITGKNYRLPTEAEWEYAARGGNKSKGYKYSGSNNIDEVAWYGGNDGFKTKPVGTKAPNELGIYDMSGNIQEWCSDLYRGYPPTTTIPLFDSFRVLRGGYWGSNPQECRVSSRDSYDPERAFIFYGFRLVLP